MLHALSTLLWLLTGVYVTIVLLFLLGLFFPRKGLNKRQFTVSVVIAARNEEDTIELCLKDLLHQTYPKEKYEIIVVNDNSTDLTETIIKRYAERYHFIHYVEAGARREGMSPKKNALTAGIQRSSAEIILSTDADCRVRSTWIEAMVSYFTPKVGMVIGYSQLGRRYDRHTFFENLQALDFLALLSSAGGACNLNFALAATGQNIAYRRSVFEEVDGFSSIGHRISGDDVLFLQLVRGRTDWKIRFAASSRAFNTSRPESSFYDFLQQRIRWASNGAYQVKQNIYFFTYVLLVYAFNLALGVCAALGFLQPVLWRVFFGCLVCKLFAELLLLLRGAAVFDRKDLLRFFPLWTFLQVPYIITVGMLGTFGVFKWKDRSSTASGKNNSGGAR